MTDYSSLPTIPGIQSSGVTESGGLQPGNYVASDVLKNLGYESTTLMSPEQLNAIETLKNTQTADNWMTSLGGYEGIQAGLGLGQLGLGALSYFDQKPLLKKQVELLDHNTSQNRFVLDTFKNRQKDIGGAFGSGLAAQSVVV